MYGSEAKHFAAKCVRNVHAQLGTANRKMKDLTYGRVAEIFNWKRILCFGNLLRRCPANNPDLRFARSKNMNGRNAKEKDTEQRPLDKYSFHCGRFNIHRASINRNALNISSIRRVRVNLTVMRRFLVLFLPCSFCPGNTRAQNPALSTSPPSVAFTAEQDHQNMMDQLGIKALRPGPSGNEKLPNHANYDEAKANPFPDIPDPLKTNNGQKVTSAKIWWDQRRPELVDMFEKYVYGRVPANIPKVAWTVRATDHEIIAFTPVIAKDLIGTVDNSSYPAITLKLHMTLVTPANAKGPVPVLMMFVKAGFPAPNEPSAEEFERINTAWKALLVQQDPSLQEVFAQHPAWEPVKATPFQFPQLTKDGDPPATWQLIGAGWGFALFDTASVQADDGAGITRGIIGLVNKGQPRKPQDWGALRAGRGARAAVWTTSKPIRQSMRNTSASRESRVSVRPPWSQWHSISASPWCWSVPPERAVPRSCGVTSVKLWRT